MLKNFLLILLVIVCNISLSYSKIKSNEVDFYCNSTSQINSKFKIDKLFHNLTSKITKLTLTCNYKSNINLTPASFPKNLSIEHLSFNGFNVHMSTNSFENLKSLKYLGFKNCTFSNFQVNPFGNLQKLYYLDLSHNAINIFNYLLIPLSSNLARIDLSNNNISFFSENIYKHLLEFVHEIDIRNNTLQCQCINRWIYSRNFHNNRLIVDRNLYSTCVISTLNIDCPERSLSFGNVSQIEVLAFHNVVMDCPIDLKTPLQVFKLWISPHNEIFGFNHSNNYDVLNNVKFSIQPLFIETKIWINETNYSLNIRNIRGYFRGNWTCLFYSQSGEAVNKTTNLIVRVRTKEIFDFSITIGFSFAGAWLLIAICVGLFQYCRETSCCRHKIDYNKSNLFEKSYVQTVIPVPFVDSVSESSSNDSEANCSQPLNHRMRYDSHNNDVQLIFKDQELADEYAQMLSQLKEASETGDEDFRDRLTTLRTRFSIDFNKMRFELKRGMEQLRSNSSAAAHKLRKSVGHMKNHMKSFSEFCGTSNMAQSISIVVISDSPNISNPNTRSDDGDFCQQRHEKKKVFRFFEPL